MHGPQNVTPCDGGSVIELVLKDVVENADAQFVEALSFLDLTR